MCHQEPGARRTFSEGVTSGAQVAFCHPSYRPRIPQTWVALPGRALLPPCPAFCPLPPSLSFQALGQGRAVPCKYQSPYMRIFPL